MDIVGFLIFLAIGAVVGWLAGNILKGCGFGLLGIIVRQRLLSDRRTSPWRPHPPQRRPS